MEFPNLREYAIKYLARYSNTETGLRRLLKRKAHRWFTMRQREEQSQDDYQHFSQEIDKKIDEVVNDMKRIGSIDDESYITYKFSSLIRSGYSRNIIRSRLMQKGFAADLIETSLQKYEENDADLLAALIYVKKRRIGPFRRIAAIENPEMDKKEQMMLARRGFSFTIANKVLLMKQSEAEEYIAKLRDL